MNWKEEQERIINRDWLYEAAPYRSNPNYSFNVGFEVAASESRGIYYVHFLEVFDLPEEHPTPPTPENLILRCVKPSLEFDAVMKETKK